MATTIRVRIATAAVAAAVAITGFAPQANAGILDIITTGLSFSAGDYTDYNKPLSSRRSGTHRVDDNTAPMASPRDDEPLSEIDRILQTSPKPKGARTGAVEPKSIWPDSRSETKARQVLARINDHRRARKEQPLKLDNSMSAGAQEFAAKLAGTKVLKHDSGMYKYAEMLAMRTTVDDDSIAEGFVQQWENSTSHRALMHRGTFSVAGVGIAYDDDSGQVFAVVRLYY